MGESFFSSVVLLLVFRYPPRDMTISRADVERMKTLSRLAMDEEETKRMEGQLDRILGYVDRLAEVDTTGVPESDPVLFAHGPREDEAVLAESSTRRQIISNFPDALADALRVPAVFENPKG